MNILITSKIIGLLIERHYNSSTTENRDCRLVIPGLTKRIAKEVHEYLVNKKVNSYLIVGEEDLPDLERRFISAVGLTSMRIGSFVAIAYPGQLINIQDSIRGTGGAIRSLAFSEEWPWIDDGNEKFRFDGPFLDLIVKEYSDNSDDQRWLYDFIKKGLLEHVRSSPLRTQIFLENILGTFESNRFPQIMNLKEQFLYHSGVPRQKNINTISLKDFINEEYQFCREIVNRSQKEDDLRNQVLDTLEELYKDSEKLNTARQSIEKLLDGLGKSNNTDLGVLAFHGSWGTEHVTPEQWLELDINNLSKIFKVRLEEKASLFASVSCSNSIIVCPAGKGIIKIASFHSDDSQINVEVTFNIPNFEAASGSWSIRLINRQQVIYSSPLTNGEGEIKFSVSTKEISKKYIKKILLKLCLYYEEQNIADSRIEVHLCGDERPAFVVIEPEFDVVDAILIRDDDTPQRKIIVEEPLSITLFSIKDDNISIKADQEEELDIYKANEKGIWCLAQKLDVSKRPSGQIEIDCAFEDLNAIICFESVDIEKGEFTIEDELRCIIAGLTKGKIDLLVKLFKGESREHYPMLGGIDDISRRRINLAKIVTSYTGWRPLLTNLLKTENYQSGTIGNYINYYGNVEAEPFVTLDLPDLAQNLVKEYTLYREKIIREIQSSLDNNIKGIEHPVYATHPIYINSQEQEREVIISRYLQSYINILSYLESTSASLEWSQLFVLCHLDCIVNWDSTDLKNAFYLISPWHPLVLAKRYMVQSALYKRAFRFSNDDKGKTFRHLSALLGQVQGFRWLIGVASNDRKIEPNYVTNTSDPGWHIAFKTNCDFSTKNSGIQDYNSLFNKIKLNLGLIVITSSSNIQDLTITALSSYLRAFPSRRTVGIRIRQGYDTIAIINKVVKLLQKNEEEVTDQGLQLAGGIRLYFEEKLPDELEFNLNIPQVFIYEVKNDAECIQDMQPDLYMIPPPKELVFSSFGQELKLPRGQGLNSVFSQSLKRLTEGRDFIPISLSYEFDYVSEQSNSDLGGYFRSALSNLSNIIGTPLSTTLSTHLPQRLDAPWVVIPGQTIDPAILVKYVRDGADRNLQERALWDYKIDISGSTNSFFILSAIPSSFQLIVNGFFGDKNVASSFIVELGKLGLAIGGEALKSGRNALGVIGLIGAVKLLVGKTKNGESPVQSNQRNIGLVIPVDSFSAFFGRSEIKRTDLIVIKLIIPDEESGDKLIISSVGVEAKFVSGTFNKTKVTRALEQASASVEELRSLIHESLKDGGMPERLALLELISFGLRINSPSLPVEIEAWIKQEQTIYQAILDGNYEFRYPSKHALLVSTEGELVGAAEVNNIEEGLWLRLTKSHWPDIHETEHIQQIRDILYEIFHVKNTSSIAISNPPLTIRPEIPVGPSTHNIVDPETEISKNAQEESKELNKTTKQNEEKTQSNEAPLDKIIVGVDNARRIIYFDPQSPINPLDNLNLMITGSPGTGKTQLLKYLILKVREQGKNVLVLDFKNDFASDKVFCQKAELEKVFVAFDGLPYNPLIPYPVRHPETGLFYVQCKQHIVGISSILKKIYGLGDQQHAAVKDAINKAFIEAGIQTNSQILYNELERKNLPDFSDIDEPLRISNLQAYNRLDPLFNLDLFREDYKRNSFESMVNRSIVLDLSQIPSDQIKNAIAQLIVLSAHSYYNSQPHSGSLRQLLIFDEAHRVMNSDSILALVRECRAYGVGVMLSSQFPTDFPDDISGAMATKMLHNNGNESNRVRDIVKMLGDETKEGEVANLDRFQAFMNNSQVPKTCIRTFNYPIYLILSKLNSLNGNALIDQLKEVEGIDFTKLPLDYLISQIERLGVAEKIQGRVVFT